MVRLGELAEELQLEGGGGEGRVKVEGAGVLDEPLSDLGGRQVGVGGVLGRDVGQHGSGAEGEVGEGAAAVGEDDLDVGVAADGA